MSKGLARYIATFDYFDKTLIFLSVTKIYCFFATIIDTPVGIASESFSYAFSITTESVKKLLKTTGNEKKTHNNIAMLTRSKLNSIGSTISKVLMDNEINHEDFTTIINEEKNYP